MPPVTVWRGKAGGEVRPATPSVPPQPQAPVGAGTASAAGSGAAGLIFAALAACFVWAILEVSRRRRLLPELRRSPLLLHALERPG